MQSPEKQLDVTLVQTEIVWQAAQENCHNIAARLEQHLRTADSASTDLIVLPEMFNSGFTMNAEKVAETMDGATVQWMRTVADKYQAAVTGSLVIQDEGKNYNRMVFAKPGGQLEYYDKRHLFRMADEDKRYAAGDRQVTVDWAGWRIALNVCYDLRFPVWCRARNNVDLMLFVASWPAARRYPWQSLLKARAIENLSYVIGVNRIGTDANGIDHCGDSALIDYMGKEINSLQDRDCLINLSLDARALASYREKFPAWMDSDDFSIHT